MERLMAETDADKELPALALKDPCNAARLAAEFLIYTMDRLQAAAWLATRGKGKKWQPIVESQSPELPIRLVRLKRYMTLDVANAALDTHGDMVTFADVTETSYLRVTWRLGTRWLLWLSMASGDKSAGDELDAGKVPKLTIGRVVKGWERAARLSMESGIVDHETLKGFLFRESRSAKRNIKEASHPVWLGDGKIKIGEHTYALTAANDILFVDTLLDNKGAARTPDFTEAGVTNPAVTAKHIVKWKGGILEPYFTLPARVRNAGFRTIIRDGRADISQG